MLLPQHSVGIVHADHFLADFVAFLCCSRRYELAEYFWQKGGNAIPNALICSRVCIGIATTPVLKEPRFEEIQSSFHSISAKFETLGIDVMTRCYAVDAIQTQLVILAELSAYDWVK